MAPLFGALAPDADPMPIMESVARYLWVGQQLEYGGSLGTPEEWTLQYTAETLAGASVLYSHDGDSSAHGMAAHPRGGVGMDGV